MSIEVGSTVCGAFPVDFIDPKSMKSSQINLADHHSVVVAKVGEMLLLAYSGSDESASNSLKRGYIAFPNNLETSMLAGWKLGKKCYVDVSRLAFVPVDAVEAVGRLPRKLMGQILTKALSLAQSPLTYNPKHESLVTGCRRQDLDKKAFARPASAFYA